MLARRIERPSEAGRAVVAAPSVRAAARTRGRWRTRGRIPTRGPAGVVRWWERPAPDVDVDRWTAVQRIQERRLALGVSVTELARRSATTGRPLRRETLSRVLNGRQPTTWETVEVLAEVLDVDV